MNWRVYQRILELTAIGMMMVGIVMMWMRRDPNHYLIYFGFIVLSSGKLVEAVNLDDPGFRILKVVVCLCIDLLVLLHLFFQVRSIMYIALPLGIYYSLHYRWMFQQRKT